MARITVPSRVVQLEVPTGASKLPLIELTRADVRPNKKPLDIVQRLSDLEKAKSVGQPTSVGFDSMKFFHAAVKTSLTTALDDDAVNAKATAFAALHIDTFVWHPENFRRADRDYLSYTEFDESGIAGRMGEAIAYLTMVEKGYVYWDRCSSVWSRALRKTVRDHAERLRIAELVEAKLRLQKKGRAPDFVFETKHREVAKREVALMEAKGSFVRDYPSTKGDLFQATQQLKAWSGFIRPTPKKSFAIGTYLRELGDNGGQSFIACVDPPGTGDPDLPPIELPTEIIQRGNYGTWLRGMGFARTGSALGEMQEIATRQIDLPVINIAGTQFAVVVLGLGLGSNVPVGIAPWDFPPFHFDYPHSLLVMGLDAKILKTIGDVLRNPMQQTLSKAEEDSSPANDEIDEPYNNQWSALPDGTCVGLISGEVFGRGARNSWTFNL